MVFKINKTLYELKQAPRSWNKIIDGFLGINSVCEEYEEFRNVINMSICG